MRACNPEHVSLAGAAQSHLDLTHTVNRVGGDPGKRHLGGKGPLDHAKRDPRLGREPDRIGMWAASRRTGSPVHALGTYSARSMNA